MNEESIRTTFENHKDPKTGSILASSLKSALLSLGITLHTRDFYEILKSRGLNDVERLDLQEFMSIVSIPSPIEEWVRSLPLCQLVADAMPKNDSCIRADQLRQLSTITQEQLQISCGVIMEHLVKILRDKLVVLEQAYAKTDSRAGSDNNENSGKFQICKMNIGNIKDFHEGLAPRIGKMRC